MQKVNASTVLFYKRGEDGKPVDSELSLVGIESSFKSIQFPKTGITFLYGHRNPAVAYLLKYAGFSGMGAAIVDVSVNIGRWPRFKASLGDDPERGLAYTGVLSLSRVLKEVVVELNRASVELVKRPLVDKGFIANPVDLDSVMKHETFKHLTLVTYMVETTEAGQFQVATLFDLAKIDDVTTGIDLKDVELILDV